MLKIWLVTEQNHAPSFVVQYLSRALTQPDSVLPANLRAKWESPARCCYGFFERFLLAWGLSLYVHDRMKEIRLVSYLVRGVDKIVLPAKWRSTDVAHLVIRVCWPRQTICGKGTVKERRKGEIPFFGGEVGEEEGQLRGLFSIRSLPLNTIRNKTNVYLYNA